MSLDLTGLFSGMVHSNGLICDGRFDMYTTEMTSDDALEAFGTGLDCSQLVFAEFATQLGMDRETALMTAASFGGGMWEGETCGAVTGALMALGLKYGHTDSTDPGQKNIMMAKGMEFKKRFAERNGSCICRDLLGYKIPEDMESIMAENKFGTVCCHMVSSACEICADILNED